MSDPLCPLEWRISCALQLAVANPSDVLCFHTGPHASHDGLKDWEDRGMILLLPVGGWSEASQPREVSLVAPVGSSEVAEEQVAFLVYIVVTQAENIQKDEPRHDGIR